MNVGAATPDGIVPDAVELAAFNRAALRLSTAERAQITAMHGAVEPLGALLMLHSGATRVSKTSLMMLAPGTPEDASRQEAAIRSARAQAVCAYAKCPVRLELHEDELELAAGLSLKDKVPWNREEFENGTEDEVAAIEAALAARSQKHKDHVAQMKQCSRCHRAYYCSPECQKGHWPAHKELCSHMAKDVDQLAPKLKASASMKALSQAASALAQLASGALAAMALIWGSKTTPATLHPNLPTAIVVEIDASAINSKFNAPFPWRAYPWTPIVDDMLPEHNEMVHTPALDRLPGRRLPIHEYLHKLQIHYLYLRSLIPRTNPQVGMPETPHTEELWQGTATFVVVTVSGIRDPNYVKAMVVRHGHSASDVKRRFGLHGAGRPTEGEKRGIAALANSWALLVEPVVGNAEREIKPRMANPSKSDWDRARTIMGFGAMSLTADSEGFKKMATQSNLKGASEKWKRQVWSFAVD